MGSMREGGGPTVLLTGTTGFVGGNLAGNLLASKQDRLACLVRAETDAAAASRGLETLEDRLGRTLSAAERSRIDWVRGDVSEPGLGLGLDVRRHVSRHLREIFHCAATTRFDGSREETQRTNVGGTRHLLELAREASAMGTFRRFHYVSTAFAAGDVHGSVTPDCLPGADQVDRSRNEYERSKVDAEKLVRATKEVPSTIYRPSIIVGNSSTGRTTSWNVVYPPMRLATRGALPIAPGGGGKVSLDCVPIDYVVDGITSLGRRVDTEGRAFHLTAGRLSITCGDLARFVADGMARMGVARPWKTITLGPRSWAMASSAVRRWGPQSLRVALERFSVFEPYVWVRSRFENGVERHLLCDEGVYLPSPESFFPRLVDYALSTDFGRLPDESGTPQEMAVG